MERNARKKQAPAGKTALSCGREKGCNFYCGLCARADCECERGGSKGARSFSKGGCDLCCKHKGLACVFVFVWRENAWAIASALTSMRADTKTMTAPQPSELSRRAIHMWRGTASWVRNELSLQDKEATSDDDERTASNMTALRSNPKGTKWTAIPLKIIIKIAVDWVSWRVTLRREEEEHRFTCGGLYGGFFCL